MGHPLSAIRYRDGSPGDHPIRPDRRRTRLRPPHPLLGTEIDFLASVRLPLETGIGQNEAEHEALTRDFRTRGGHCEEPIGVMRVRCPRALVDFQGRWHRIRGCVINPLPVQPPVPIWIGDDAEAGPCAAPRASPTGGPPT